jgi:MoaA/NifB/PqqE/SkfB family radical SAM enzyme
MCYVHLSQEDVDAQGKELTAQQWIDLAREAKEMGMISVLLTGGEPFVRPDFFEIFHAIKSMGLLVSINSNGSMLKGKVLQQLLQDPPHRINISLYGGCNETYRSMCGLSAYDSVVESVRALKEAGVDVRLNVSITPHNRHDLKKIHETGEKLGVIVKASAYMYPSIRVNGEQYGCNNRLSAEEAASCGLDWDELRMSREEFNRRAKSLIDRVPFEENECMADLDHGVGCRAGSTTFWMTWDGRMLPCGMMPRPVAYPLEIGFKAAWEQTRQETAAIRMPKECVANCPNRKMCAVCAAVCITETGSFDQKPEYVCRMTHESIRQAIERSDYNEN